MEVGGGEVRGVIAGVHMASAPQVLVHDALELGVRQVVAKEAVQKRRPPGDAGREERTAGSEDTAGFAEGDQTISPVREVIQRTQEQDHVHAPIREGEGPRIPDVSGGQHATRRLGPFLREADESWDGVQEVDLVAAVREPEGIGPRGATDIRDGAGRRGRMGLDQCLGSRRLQLRAP